MPLEALSNHEIETDLLDDLVEKGLARQVDSENYDVHDLVREFLLGRLILQLRRHCMLQLVHGIENDWMHLSSNWNTSII